MLSREQQPMPNEVKKALIDSKLMSEYLERPEYQQNDYLGWINRAKQKSTKDKRLNQMINELRVGGVYMKIDHPPSRRR